jgi:hypothetical protein
METPGYVYAIQMEGHPIYKLGRCNNVPRRLSEIGIQLPFPYQIIFARRVSSPIRIETAIHQTLADDRTNGEWFRLNELQIEYLGVCLLLLQAQELTDKLIEELRLRHDGDSCIVERYARLLVMAAKRLRRRELLVASFKRLTTPLLGQEVETIQ